MIKRIITITVIFAALALASQPARAQMSDDAVIAYVKDGMATGKSQKDMAKELAARGVTQAQAERIKAKYEQEQAGLGAHGQFAHLVEE